MNDIVSEFIAYLKGLEHTPSKSTIKNYRADINRFISWYQKQYYKAFNPTLISPEIVSEYKKTKDISARSIERHLSSLRRFFSFLKEKGTVENLPFEPKLASMMKNNDPYKLRDFKNYLYVYNSSNLTIKNYISDIRQFMDWLTEVSDVKATWLEEEKNIFKKIQAIAIEEYKTRLREAGLSPVSINRKLSSIRKFIDWAKSEHLIKNLSYAENIKANTKQIEFKPALNSNQAVKEFNLTSYSGIAPVRVIQKLKRGSEIFFDGMFISPLANATKEILFTIWNVQGKNVFKSLSGNKIRTPRFIASIKNFPKSTYAPLEVSTAYFPWYKKLYYDILHKRPKWYKEYHLNPFVHHLHFAILLLYIVIVGIFFYQNINTNKTGVLGTKNQAEVFTSQTIPFQGKLADKDNNPIDKTTEVTFSIYDNPTLFGQAMLWQEQQSITPDKDGLFNTTLGKIKPLSEELFINHAFLYLGITIGSDSELKPRQQLPNVYNAQNAQTLQGLPLLSQSNSPNNVILNLDSSGNLNIPNSSPIFQATGGTFTLSGQVLSLTTSPGSSGDVQIAPDSSGKIDLQKPIHNTTNNNNIDGASGAVEVDDLFAILATSSAQSAFTINQNDTGPIISASSSGIAKFTLSSDGSSYLAGNLGVGIQNPISKVQVKGNIAPGETNTYDLGSPSLRFDTLYINSIVASSSGTLGYWQRNNSDLSTENISDAINLGGRDSGSALTRFSGSSGDSFINAGNLGIGTKSPTAKLNIKGSNTGSGMSFLISDSNNKDIFTALNNGNIGIGDSSPQAALKVTGAICVKAASGACLGNTPGTIYAETTTLQAGDVAENYISRDALEPGDAVSLANDGNNLAVVKSNSSYDSKVIGIVSTKPGVTINSDATTDANHPYKYPIALIGRVALKVSTENGPIKAGDFLTTSSTPGVAMRATQAGVIIGKALEAFPGTTGIKGTTSTTGNSGSPCDTTDTCDTRNTSIVQGKIMVYAQTSWYDSNAHINNLGDFVITKNASTSANLALGIQNQTPTYNLYDNSKFVDNVSAFASSAIANLRSGVIEAEDISVNTLSAANATINNIKGDNIISPIAQIDMVKTNVISPLSSDSIVLDGKLIVQTASDSAITVKNASGSAVASIDSFGNASFSATLTSNDLSVNNDATVSGVLRAKKIIADSIESSNSSPSAQYITNITNIYSSTPSAEVTNENNASSSAALSSLLNSDFPEFNPLDISTFSAGTVKSNFLNAYQGEFSNSLMVLGPTSLNDTSVAGQLSVGSTLVLQDNTINTLGTDLEIQPFRLGAVSFLAGLVRIDNNGNLSVSGNADFSGNVSVKGTLSAGVISPLPNSDIKMTLGSLSAMNEATNSANPHQSQRFIVQNASGSAVLSVNQIGDLITSGSATLKKLNLGLVQDAIAVSDDEIIASGSAGIATISAKRSSITIDNPLVTNHSLIYITPRVETNNQTLFLQRSVPEKSFTVGIESAAASDIPFNYLIIN